MLIRFVLFCFSVFINFCLQIDESFGSKSVKSSTAFFTHLQDEVKSQIKAKAAEKRKNTKANVLSAKKIKL